MNRILPVLLVVGFTVYCVVEIVQSDVRSRRGVPAALWVLVALVPVLGGLAWIVSSRTARAGQGGTGQGGGGTRPRRPGGRPGGGPVAPDDDPDFLRRLDEERRRRQRAQDGTAGAGGADAAGDDERGQGASPDGPVTQN